MAKDTLEGRRIPTSSLIATAKAINEGKGMAGATAGLEGGLGGLLKQMNAAANEVGRDSAEGVSLINAALRIRRENPREFRGRGVRRR